MNYRKILITAGLALLYLHAKAQETNSFTLQEAIAYALSNQVSIKNSEIDLLSAKAKVGETRGLGLPQVDAQFQVLHNIEIQKVILENDPSNPAFFNPNIPAGAVLAFPFQLRNNGGATLNINQLIFDGSYLVGLRAASTYKLLAEKQLSQTKTQVAEQVSKAYYGVLVNRERAKLLELNVARVDSFFRNSRELYLNGFAEKIDVDRLEVQLNNIKVEKQKIDALVSLSENLLKFQMGYPMQQQIITKDDLASINLQEITVPSEAVNYNSRIEYSILQTQRDLARLDLQNNRAAYLPKLYGFGTTGYNPGASKFDDLFNFSDRWFNYSFVGVQLRMNLLTGLSQSYRAQQARLTLQKTEQSFKLLENSIDIELQQAKINLETSLETLKSQKRNLALAEDVARVTKLKYEEGVGSSLEVTDAENAFRQAQINYYASVYDALIAEIDYKKATGTLLK